MFTGFTPETIDFLWGIRMNNNRDWFLEHKKQYVSTLYEPMKALGKDLFTPFMEIPGTILKVSRIYRDARRLHGQGPYKDHLWFCIRTGDQDWTGRPTFYFEIGPDYYSYGMGFWCPRPALMAAYRRGIDQHPETLSRLVRQFNRQEVFTLSGPEYARSKGETTALLQPWYNRKSINLQHDGPLDERIFSPELAQDVIDGFRTLMPLYRYFDKLCASVAES